MLDKYINEILEEKHGYLNTLLKMEQNRQKKNIELIASENYPSDAVRAAMASVLTNKYAEGTPGQRYYGGCDWVDEIEDYCEKTWQKVFNTKYTVNVQPHSGTQANYAAYAALINPGDTILSLNLNSGSHLSHGSHANFSGKLYNIVNYNIDSNGYIDYKDFANAVVYECPKLIIAGGSAYPRQIDFQKMRNIMDAADTENRIYFMVDMAHIAGLVAAGEHPSPFGCADIITTTTHKTLRGPRGGLIFCTPNLKKKVDSAVFPGSQGGPLEHVILAKAICAEEALEDSYKEYIHNVVVNAKAMADEFMKMGYDVVSGGTDTHLFLIDFSKTHPQLSGLEIQQACDNFGITLNRNCVPNEKRSPYFASGVRIGTPAMTTRGWTEENFRECAHKIDNIIQNLTRK